MELLQTAADPYITILGPIESATSFSIVLPAGSPPIYDPWNSKWQFRNIHDDKNSLTGNFSL